MAATLAIGHPRRAESGARRGCDGGHQQWADHHVANQRFRSADPDAGHTRLINRTGNKAVEAQGASTVNVGR